MTFKNAFLLTLALSLALNLSSQEKKNNIIFSIGPSFGVGNFGENSYENKYAGGAGTGIDFYAFYGYEVSENVSIGIKGFVNSNKFDNPSTLDAINSSGYYNWKSSGIFWSTSGILLGLTLHVPASESFVIDFRLLGGYVHSGTPEGKIYAENDNSVWFSLTRAKAGAFGYNIGTGFTYLFNPGVGFTINLDYIGANFSYDKIKMTTSGGHSQTTSHAEQPCTIINTTIGIVFIF